MPSAPLSPHSAGRSGERIADRYGLRLIVARAAAGNAVCWFLMAFASSVWHVLLIRTALGILGGFNSVSVATMLEKPLVALAEAHTLIVVTSDEGEHIPKFRNTRA